MKNNLATVDPHLLYMYEGNMNIACKYAPLMWKNVV